VGGNGVSFEEPRERPAKDVIVVKSFSEELWYPTRERRPFGEWWKNHFLPQHSEEQANVAIFEGSLNYVK
jgi:hypothetical protein